jgi:hypothetical protein
VWGLLGHGHVIPRPDRKKARCGGPALCAKCKEEQAAVDAAAAAERERQQTETHTLYRERADLLAYLAARHPGGAWLGMTDPAAPDWPVLTVLGATGQMCWHISGNDLDLFEHVPWTRPGSQQNRPPAWDGHTTDEKYDRLRRLVADMSGSGDRVPQG